jgi:putative modified peptide
MSDAALTTQQTIKLLLELATNDAFRLRFEEKPAAALVELGIPHETVINLNAACLSPATLADKATFVEAHRQLVSSAIIEKSKMIIPPNLILNRPK